MIDVELVGRRHDLSARIADADERGDGDALSALAEINVGLELVCRMGVREEKKADSTKRRKQGKPRSRSRWEDDRKKRSG